MGKALKIQELSNLGHDELVEKLTQLRKELMQFRFQKKTGKLEQQSMFQITKRNIARILTLMNERKKEEVKS